MPAEINRTKVLGELFHYVVWLNDQKELATWRRLSPATREVHEMLETSIRACMEAVREGHPLMFEINIWEQSSLTGWAINAWDDENPIQIE